MHSKKKRLIKLFVYDVLPDIRINIPERQLIKKKRIFITHSPPLIVITLNIQAFQSGHIDINF